MRLRVPVVAVTAALAVVGCTAGPPASQPPAAVSTPAPTPDPVPTQTPSPTGSPPPTGDPPLSPQEAGRLYEQAVREQVLVPFGHDLDGDGQDDQVSIDIIRPATASADPVPVILVSSVYYFEAGRGPEGELKQVSPQGVVEHLPLYYDNYFVPRGYAVAAMDNPGTGRSSGCMDVLGPSDVDAAVAAVEYLAGTRDGLDPQGQWVRADWSNGRVGMAGKSYDGSVATAVAQRGTPELAAVVTEAGLSDVYSYARPGGVIRYPHWSRWYAEAYHSPQQAELCESFLSRVDQESAEDSGERTGYWNERDFISDLSRWRTPTLITHGLADWNVIPNQGTDLYQGLRDSGVPTQLWLSQSGHEAMFDLSRQEFVARTELWFDHWLRGVDNGVTSLPPVRAQSATDLDTWSDQADWPLPHRSQEWGLGVADDQGLLQPRDQQDGATGTDGTASFTDSALFDSRATLQTPGEQGAHHLQFATAAMSQDLELSGTPRVRLSMEVQGVESATLSVKLISLGPGRRVDQSVDGGIRLLDERDCLGGEVQADPPSDGCFQVVREQVRQTGQGLISQGWLRMSDLDGAGEVELELSPVQTTVAAGQQLVLLVHGTDSWFVIDYADPCAYSDDPERPCLIPPVVGTAEYRLDLGGSTLELPVRTRD